MKDVHRDNQVCWNASGFCPPLHPVPPFNHLLVERKTVRDTFSTPVNRARVLLTFKSQLSLVWLLCAALTHPELDVLLSVTCREAPVTCQKGFGEILFKTWFIIVFALTGFHFCSLTCAWKLDDEHRLYLFNGNKADCYLGCR